jgi:hypothetical protein
MAWPRRKRWGGGSKHRAHQRPEDDRGDRNVGYAFCVPESSHCPPPAVESVSGRGIAFGPRNVTERALLAADLVVDRRRVINPTIRQAARLVGVSPAYVSVASRVSGEERARLARGSLTLSAIVAPRKPAPLADAWRAASAAQRIDFIRAVGVADVWDVLELAIA